MKKFLIVFVSLFFLSIACKPTDPISGPDFTSGYVCFTHEGYPQHIGIYPEVWGQTCVTNDEGAEICRETQRVMTISDVPGCFKFDQAAQSNVKVTWQSWCFMEETRTSVDLSSSPQVQIELTRNNAQCNADANSELVPVCSQFQPTPEVQLTENLTACETACLNTGSDCYPEPDACCIACDTEYQVALALNETLQSTLEDCCYDQNVANAQPETDNICPLVISE